MKKVFFVFALSGVFSLCGSSSWKSAVTLRCTFEDQLPQGVKAVGEFRSVPGISGKGARFNRAGWNNIYYFAVKPSAAGAVAVCPALSVVRGNSVSFSARGRGKMVLTLRSGAKTEKRTIKVDSKEWRFYNTVFTAPENLGTVVFKAEMIQWKEPQVTSGWELPAVYAPFRKVVPGCYLEIDPAKKYLDLDRGAFALWIKTPYLNSKAAMDHIGIFGIDHALKPVKLHPDQQIFCMTAWNGRNFSAYRMAETGKGNCSVTLPLTEFEFKKDEWHHILFNWERKGKELFIELYVDGGKIKLHTSCPYGKDKSVKRITAGYSDYAHLNGDADDLVIFKRPLTPQEAKELYNARGNWK